MKMKNRIVFSTFVFVFFGFYRRGSNRLTKKRRQNIIKTIKEKEDGSK